MWQVVEDPSVSSGSAQSLGHGSNGASVLRFSPQSGRDGVLLNSVRKARAPANAPSPHSRMLAEKGTRLAFLLIPPEKYHSLPRVNLFQTPFSKTE